MFRTIILTTALLLAGCATAATPEEGAVTLSITVDGDTRIVTTSPASTIDDVLRQENITLGELDDINPEGFRPVSDGLQITIVRVREETEVIEQVVPFERRRTVNDSLPAGDQQLLNAGVNGLEEITYRVTYRDGVEVNRSLVNRVLITPPEDEVIMVGSQTELPTITVGGTIIYVSGDNAWIVRQTSANRRPLTLDGGIDLRVFEVSADGRQVLFTRSEQEEAGVIETPEAAPDPEQGPFNTLWLIADTSDPESQPLRLDLDNVLYAEWVPGAASTIVYSTGEARPGFPGWQANNDLWVGQIGDDGAILNREQLLEASSGGVYGWYGTTFAIAPDGSTLAWAQPDAVGMLRPIFEEEAEDGEGDEEPVIPTQTPTPEAPIEDVPLLTPTAFEREVVLSFAPRNAYDFVWRPEPNWSPDGQLIITGVHGPPLGAEAPEDSPVFGLTAFPSSGEYSVELVEQVGLFAFPRYAPGSSGSVAYLQAEEPLSQQSRYRLVVRDRDGSNPRVLFPEESQPGMRPNRFAWSPDARQIAVSYQGNIFLVDVITGLAQQLTGDGLSETVWWTP